MRRAAILVAALALSAGAASAQDEPGRTDAVVRGTDYCIAVVEAGLAGREPILDGPQGFSEHREPYGQLAWRFGRPANSPLAVSVSPSVGHCSVWAGPGESPDGALKALIGSKVGFVADNPEGTRYHRTAEGGWVLVAWTNVELEGPGRGPLWVLVSSRKETD